MQTVADALRTHAEEFLRNHRAPIPLELRKVLSWITRCRTGQLGSLVYQCDSCQRRHWIGRGCGNRHCPNCQVQKTAQWLQRQSEKLLPVEHFVVTCTVPDELRTLLRAHRKQGYHALFAAGSQMIRLLLANPRYLGSQRVGFFGALHTWGRDPLVYHPHVHFVVPGGGISNDGSRWLSTPKGFLFPHARACALYKKCFADVLRACGLYDQVPATAWQAKWVVDIKPVGDGQAVLKYLAPYVYRVAISNNRIRAVTNQHVTYAYTPSGTKSCKVRSVEGPQFVAGFLQHILPPGFQKIRYYGTMSPNCRNQQDNVRWLVWLHRGWTYWLAAGLAPPRRDVPRPPVRCAQCGTSMRIIALVAGDGKVILGNPNPHVRAPP